MLLSLLATTLCAAPATGLTLSAQLGKVSTPVAAYLDAIEQELISSGLPVRRLTLTCDGKRECLISGAKTAGLPALVAVSVAYGKKQTTLDLEALRVDDGATVSQFTFAVSGRLSEDDREGMRKFGAQLVAALPVSDAPLAEVKKDSVVAPQVLELTQAPPKVQRSSAPGWLLGGGAVAAGVTSGIFVGLASAKRGELESTPNPSPLTRAQADRMAAEANRDYTVALATGIAAGALATAAIIWLVSE